jgi:hypothetical protein
MYITEKQLIKLINNNNLSSKYMVKKCIVIIDICGFTKNFELYGLNYILKKIYNLRYLISNIIFKYNGLLFKTEADNIFMLFDNPFDGINFIIYLYNLLGCNNNISVGIGYGDIIIYTKNNYDIDIWGLEMNYTSYLAEDRAKCNEILLTKNIIEFLNFNKNIYNIQILDNDIFKLAI